MTAKPVAVYWDSCVYIDYIQREATHYPELCQIMSEAQSGQVVLVASALVIAEVVKLKQSTEPLTKQAVLIRDAFENDYIEVVSVTRDIAAEASQICRDFRIKPPDAIHLVTALRRGCRCFQTYDGEKKNPNAKKDKVYLLDLDGKIGRPSLRIELLKRIVQTSATLFDTQHPPGDAVGPDKQ